MQLTTIRSRLLVLVTVFGIAVAILNLAFLFGLTKWVEDFIFESLIRQEFARLEAIDGFSSGNSPTQVTTFRAHENWKSFPQKWHPWLSELSDGVHELEAEVSLLAMVKSGPDGIRRYLVVQTDDLEYIESNLTTVAVYTVLVLCLTFAGAVFVSLALIRRIINPLNQFTQHVSEVEVSGSLESVAGRYSDDEIGTLAKAFDNLQERLKAYIRRERRFTADISHELRTPLGVSRNALELLAERQFEEDDARVINRLHRSNTRMNALVETFIALARHENVREASTEPVSLENLVDTALEYQRYAYPQQKAVVNRQYNTELHLEGPPILLSILFRNLIVNAILHSPDHECSITGNDETVCITNTYNDASSGNSGAGIGLSIAERVSEALGVTLTTRQDQGQFKAAIRWARPKQPSGVQSDK